MPPRILEADCSCPDEKIVNEASKIIRNGGLVVAATDTLYGILADPFNPTAVARVYDAKGRPHHKPLPLLLGESHHSLLVVDPPEIFWDLAIAFWPGPLTLVARPSPRTPSHLREWGNIGVRLPDSPLVRRIALRVGGVLTGTSANKSGRESPRTVFESSSQLGDLVDLYIDCGPTLIGEPSTVVDVSSGKLILFREGAIPWSRIAEVLRGKTV